MAEEGAELGVDFGFSKLVKVTQELEDMGTAAAGEREWRSVVAEVLAEGVPVSPLLVLVAAESGGGGGSGCGRRGGRRGSCGGDGGGGRSERKCDGCRRCGVKALK